MEHAQGRPAQTHRCSATSSCRVPQAVAALPRKLARSASFSSQSATRPSGQNLAQEDVSELHDGTLVDGRRLPSVWLLRDAAQPTGQGWTKVEQFLT